MNERCWFIRQQIHKIPVWDAFHDNNECAFCALEGSAEIRYLKNIVNDMSNDNELVNEIIKQGICSVHYNKLFLYGQKFSLALLMKNLYAMEISFLDILKNNARNMCARNKKALFGWFISSNLNTYTGEAFKNNLKKPFKCIICVYITDIVDMYIDISLEMYKTDDKFKDAFIHSKGFCLPHFIEVISKAIDTMEYKQYQEFIDMVFSLERRNFKRIEEELRWFIRKNQPQHNNNSWENSKDSLRRCINKMAGCCIK